MSPGLPAVLYLGGNLSWPGALVSSTNLPTREIILGFKHETKQFGSKDGTKKGEEMAAFGSQMVCK